MSSAASNNRRPRPGRPRHIPASDTQADPRDHILAVSARLFVGHGYAGTSTRDIAEAVGIRQASLYYHFAGKDGILSELLEMTVRTALDSVGDLDQVESPEAALYLLSLRDAQALATLMHNIGMLPRCPDVSQSPAALEYAEVRRQLREAYGSLGICCSSQSVIDTISRRQLGELILNNVESVIGTRATGDVVTRKELHAVAAASLRICGVPRAQIEVARKVAVVMLDQLDQES
ncbi:TetR/AcrR family transcriptional regulator [Nocardioides sp. NPDC126508]